MAETGDSTNILSLVNNTIELPTMPEVLVKLNEVMADPEQVRFAYAGGLSACMNLDLWLAQLTGKPVQVAWSREDEFFHDSFRPAAVVQIRSGLEKNLNLSFWDYHVYFAGDRGAEQFYDIAHHRTSSHGGIWGVSPGVHPFAVGAWRAPGRYYRMVNGHRTL